MSRGRFDGHNHSVFSSIRLLDSTNKIKDLVNYAIELGLDGIALTDHECLSGAIEANKLQFEVLKEHPNFKIALGNEIYLCKNREKKQKYYHFILIAKNAQGHRALRELSSKAWLNSYYDRGMERVPTTYEELENIVKRFPGTLVASSACLGGQLSSLVMQLIEAQQTANKGLVRETVEEINKFVSWCKKLFGDDFYIECAPGCSPDQIMVNKKLVEIAKAFDLKMVCFCDSHYLNPEYRAAHRIYLNSKEGEREVDLFYHYAYLQSNEEVIKHLEESDFTQEQVEEMFDNSMEIYDKIEIYDLAHKQQISHVDVKDYPKSSWWGVNNDDADEMNNYPLLKEMFTSDDIYNRYWVNECWKGMERKGIDWRDQPEYPKRLEEEARVKKIIGEKLDTNIFRYPVVLQHYMEYVWNNDSIVGAGRGSSCSGLNHYLLGVTQLDPLKHDFPFFRYLNEERVELPELSILGSCKKSA